MRQEIDKGDNMNKDEYLIKLQSEYQTGKKKIIKKQVNYLLKDFYKILILILVFFFFSIVRWKNDVKQLDWILGFLTRLSIILVGIMVLIFLATVFLTFRNLFYNKKVYKYLSEQKHFEYDNVNMSKEVFDFSLTFAGFMAMYVRINSKIYYLEAQLKKIPDLDEKAEIGDCYINFSDAMSLEQFLNYEIDGIRIRDITKFELLSVNNRSPKAFINEFNEYSKKNK